MPLTGWITLGVILGCLLMLMRTRISADLIFMGALTLLIVSGIVSPAQGLVGFANQGMMTVAALYVVSTGLQQTGAIQFIINNLLGRHKSELKTQFRVMAPVMAISGFLNNTPVVASFIPAIQDWAHKNRIAASRLLIPLSYGAILGGMCTLLGTSTNLVVNGLLIQQTGTGISMFDPAWLGLPAAVAGLIYMLTAGRRLLPSRHSGFESFQDPREYTIEMIVNNSNSLAGKSIEEAGLRNLPGLFLAEIYRNEQIIPAVSPDEKLQVKDRLIFTGIVDSIADLQQMNGLSPATDQIFKLDTPRRERRLVEAVISPSHPLNGMTIKEGNFRNRYDAVVLAVSRNGERIKEKVGNIRLKTGDTLLLETHPNFVDQHKNSQDYYLVSSMAKSPSLNYDKAWVALTILAGMVILAATGMLSMFKASFLAALGMLATQCIRIDQARQSIDWSVLIVIAASLGIGNALNVTGAAEAIAGSVLGLAKADPLWALAGTYIVTWILTELITNNAAAVLIFPIAYSISESFGVSFQPFLMIILVAASASFTTPIGYQTNLMVYGPGGYRFTDFVRVGLPLNILVAIVTLLLTPVVWPF